MNFNCQVQTTKGNSLKSPVLAVKTEANNRTELEKIKDSLGINELNTAILENTEKIKTNNELCLENSEKIETSNETILENSAKIKTNNEICLENSEKIETNNETILAFCTLHTALCTGSIVIHTATELEIFYYLESFF